MGEGLGLSLGFTAGEGFPLFGFPGVGEGLGMSFCFTTGGGFPWFGFPGVGQDWIVLVFVIVLYLNSVFVLKTVTYETAGLGGLVIEGGGVLELGEGLASLKVRVKI